MRLINVVMPDKEFERYWKYINDEMEKRDQDMLRMARVFGMKNPWTIFEGLFGLPEECFDTIERGRKLVNVPYGGTAELRFIKAVLKG